MKNLIESLKQKINDCTSEPDEVSWGYQEGILISKNDAIKIVESLSVPSEKEAVNGVDLMKYLEGRYQFTKGNWNNIQGIKSAEQIISEYKQSNTK